jgi:ActR/RegA family two-component response regulator
MITVCATREGRKIESYTTTWVVEPQRQRLVIVGTLHWSEELAALCRQAGWEVFRLTSSSELPCAILSRRPQVVILPLQTQDESGFLIAAKVKQARPRTRILLVGNGVDPSAARFARFVGATYVDSNLGLAALLREISR